MKYITFYRGSAAIRERLDFVNTEMLIQYMYKWDPESDLPEINLYSKDEDNNYKKVNSSYASCVMDMELFFLESEFDNWVLNFSIEKYYPVIEKDKYADKPKTQIGFLTWHMSLEEYNEIFHTEPISYLDFYETKLIGRTVYRNKRKDKEKYYKLEDNKYIEYKEEELPILKEGYGYNKEFNEYWKILGGMPVSKEYAFEWPDKNP